MIRLSERLKAVYDFVDEGNVVADIGTDHGYLPIALVLDGRVPYAYACDLRRGPLSKAQQNIRDNNVSDKVKTLISDGFAGLTNLDVQTYTITGMGGRLIQDILIAGRNVYMSTSQLILSPQSEISEFRHFLAQEGYRITRESIVIEDNKCYTIMDCRYTGISYIDELTKEQLLCGEYLLGRKDMVLYEQLCREKSNRLSIIDRFNSKAHSEGITDRKRVLMDEIGLIDRALEHYLE